jgi:predicted ArsR family transcriptional regulator
MGKKTVEKFQDGEHTCERVDEIQPLGKDRKTVLAPETPLTKLVQQLENLVTQTSASGFAMLATVMNGLSEEYGDRVWEVAAKKMYEMGYARGKGVAQAMKIDPSDARSVGRIFDLEDSNIGVKGEWVETGKKRAVKREYYCPLAAVAGTCPEMCTRMFAAIEHGTFDAIGVKVKDFHFGKMMPKGDSYCEVILELE